MNAVYKPCMLDNGDSPGLGDIEFLTVRQRAVLAHKVSCDTICQITGVLRSKLPGHLADFAPRSSKVACTCEDNMITPLHACVVVLRPPPHTVPCKAQLCVIADNEFTVPVARYSSLAY